MRSKAEAEVERLDTSDASSDLAVLHAALAVVDVLSAEAPLVIGPRLGSRRKTKEGRFVT